MNGIKEFASQTVERIAALTPDELRVERVELGLCPRCGEETGEVIRENRFGYGCTSWKSKEEPGCGFVIWKKVAGRTLTPELARQLIYEGRTRDFVAGLRGRSGRQFRARLVLGEDGKVEFEFPERAAAPARSRE
jgi:DNA topoisomerase-3